jgi:hypothetical protein
MVIEDIANDNGNGQKKDGTSTKMSPQDNLINLE